MNSAAVHSAKLIAEFEKQQQQQQHEESAAKYPSEHPFGASNSGPFGGEASHSDQGRRFVSPPHHQKLVGDAFAADNEMSNFDDWDASYAGAPSVTAAAAAAAADSTDMSAYVDAGPSTTGYRPRPLTQFDYPGGWGAQTFNGVGGLTQDSASRIATLQAKLNQRLGPEYLSQRPGPGGGKKLTYIEGWKLVDLANEVFGFNGWSTTIVRLDVDFLDCSPDGTRFNAGVSCVVRVTLRDGAFHEDIGYGSAENARQKHAALEKGKKEAVTDATKRALKNFGKLLGNCTYDHQYSANALKVSNPAPKFDASELHRRPELRPPQPPQPQPPQKMPHAAANVQQPPRPPAHASAPRPVQPAAPPEPNANGNVASAAPSAAPTRPAPNMAAPQQPASAPNAASISTTARRPLNGNDASRAASSSSEKELLTERKVPEEPSRDQVAERQQRSLLARQAYLERQQADARKITATVGSSSIDSHPIITSSNGVQRHRSAAAEVEFGSDSFDDGLNDVLATYDETDLGEAEAASHAVEMEIDEAQRRRHSDEDFGGGDVGSGGLHPNHNAADDSGVAFTDYPQQMHAKEDKVNAIQMRRSTSPVKQVKMEAVKAGPRRAGSVGRFVSPPAAAAAAAAAAPAAGGVQRGNGNGNGEGRRASIVSAGGGFVSGTHLMMRNGTTSLSAASSRYNGGGGGNGVQTGPRRMHSSTLSGMGGVESAAHHNSHSNSNSNKDPMPSRAVGEAVNHGYLPTEASRGIKRAGEAVVGENGRGIPPPPPPASTTATSIRQ
ncbi:related to RAD52 - recombination and DNA repair protein [Ustilago trichophora]|uniref:Related to RAD52 - recombination and DNA repair protein n=1 Tax=Ustilago trichophora TaxID=86804 RepID=A0A5C3E0G9_9BASI|nr:related to RAD52 - recombination and DNA repair protein [Ustilago trichophora]